MTTPSTGTDIVRSVPDIDYLDPHLFTDLGIVQTVLAGDTVYVSGIAPLTGGADGLDIVSTVFTDQLVYTLGVLERSLQAVGAHRSGLVAWTIYTTDMPALAAAAPILRDWVGEHPPTSTWVGCAGLIHPEQQLELTATAVR
ncbi:MAG: RidA family protein [Actinobacteria bacterium]|nr:RidA family protein [Actinomycetota bacterium]